MGGLGSYGSKIYRKMQVEGKMGEIAKKDVVSLLSPFRSAGFGWHALTGKLQKVGEESYEQVDTPWCHARHQSSKHCALDSKYIFDLYNIVTPRCMSCWKTCMGLKNFDELMTWHKVQKNEMDIPCKSGIELRDYVPKHYGSYHYAGSLEEGREQYEIVKKLAKKYLSEETVSKLLLKRACTEFELQKGPSSQWCLTDMEEYILDAIDTHVDYSSQNKRQNRDLAYPFVQMKWLLWAHSNGDMSYLPYNNNKVLFPGYVTYHEGKVQDIKRDMALITTSKKQGLNPEMIDTFIEETDKFAREQGTTMDRLGTVFGYDKKSPTGTLIFEDVEEPVKGEADILPGE